MKRSRSRGLVCLLDLAETIGKRYDQEVFEWLWDAAYVANWWVGENWQRYRYEPGA